jgi:hypothetical protein
VETCTRFYSHCEKTHVVEKHKHTLAQNSITFVSLAFLEAIRKTGSVLIPEVALVPRKDVKITESSYAKRNFCPPEFIDINVARGRDNVVIVATFFRLDRSRFEPR